MGFAEGFKLALGVGAAQLVMVLSFILLVSLAALILWAAVHVERYIRVERYKRNFEVAKRIKARQSMEAEERERDRRAWESREATRQVLALKIKKQELAQTFVDDYHLKDERPARKMSAYAP